MSTLVLGIGNPILTDDSVGIRVARKIKEEKPELDVEETSEAGLALLDHLVGHDKIIVIDSIKTEQGEVGELFEVDAGRLKAAMEYCPSHGIDLASALEVAKGLGCGVPKSVSIYAVNISDNTTFGEGCTREIEKSIPSLARQIIRKEKL